MAIFLNKIDAFDKFLNLKEANNEKVEANKKESTEKCEKIESQKKPKKLSDEHFNLLCHLEEISKLCGETGKEFKL